MRHNSSPSALDRSKVCFDRKASPKKIVQRIELITDEMFADCKNREFAKFSSGSPYRSAETWQLLHLHFNVFGTAPCILGLSSGTLVNTAVTPLPHRQPIALPA
jgi:hypothetical protein